MPTPRLCGRGIREEPVPDLVSDALRRRVHWLLGYLSFLPFSSTNIVTRMDSPNSCPASAVRNPRGDQAIPRLGHGKRTARTTQPRRSSLPPLHLRKTNRDRPSRTRVGHDSVEHLTVVSEGS